MLSALDWSVTSISVAPSSAGRRVASLLYLYRRQEDAAGKAVRATHHAPALGAGHDICAVHHRNRISAADDIAPATPPCADETAPPAGRPFSLLFVVPFPVFPDIASSAPPQRLLHLEVCIAVYSAACACCALAVQNFLRRQQPAAARSGPLRRPCHRRGRSRAAAHFPLYSAGCWR